MKPVLLVHGWSDSYKMPWWDEIENKLVKNGIDKDKIKKVNLGSFGLTIGSPKKYARKVRKEALSLYNETGSNISVIGHSMGGLTSRYFIEFLGGEKIVDNLFTLGTPHQGTKQAYLGLFSKGGRQMRPSSKFIKKLNKNGLSEKVNYIALWSTKDFLISPKHYATLPPEIMDEKDKNLKINSMGHLKMVFSTTLFEENLNHICKCKI